MGIHSKSISLLSTNLDQKYQEKQAIVQFQRTNLIISYYSNS